MQHLKHSLPPIVNENAEILILGSMPGDMSIALNEYYGHPQNRFWRVIANITNSNLPKMYCLKKQMLLDNKIALWDVAYKATRKGSMDSEIKDETPNPINTLLLKTATCRVVAFNGKKAEQIYDKHFQRIKHIKYITLPSTSPANATITFDALCSKWREIFSSPQDKII